MNTTYENVWDSLLVDVFVTKIGLVVVAVDVVLFIATEFGSVVVFVFVVDVDVSFVVVVFVVVLIVVVVVGFVMVRVVMLGMYT